MLPIKYFIMAPTINLTLYEGEIFDWFAPLLHRKNPPRVPHTLLISFFASFC